MGNGKIAGAAFVVTVKQTLVNYSNERMEMIFRSEEEERKKEQN